MKAIFLVGNLLSVLGVLIDFLAPSFSFVVLGRLVQGMGVGFALPLMFNIILEQVPKRKIGLMMALHLFGAIPDPSGFASCRASLH